MESFPREQNSTTFLGSLSHCLPVLRGRSLSHIQSEPLLFQYASLASCSAPLWRAWIRLPATWKKCGSWCQVCPEAISSPASTNPGPSVPGVILVALCWICFCSPRSHWSRGPNLATAARCGLTSARQRPAITTPTRLCSRDAVDISAAWANASYPCPPPLHHLLVTTWERGEPSGCQQQLCQQRLCPQPPSRPPAELGDDAPSVLTNLGWFLPSLHGGLFPLLLHLCPFPPLGIPAPHCGLPVLEGSV